MHRFILILLLALPLPAAEVRFVTPQQGGQAVGILAMEVATDTTNVDRVEFHVDGVLVGVARKAPYRIVYDFGSSTAARRIRAKVISDGFRRTDEAEITTMPLTGGESIDVDLVEVPLRARSRTQITAGDLRIRENGVEQTIREVLPQRGAAHFVFVIDRSLSMDGGKLVEALTAVDEQRKLLRADDRVSVVLFNHNVARIRGLERGERATQVFADTTPSGGTALRDALASLPSRERTFALVVTDGGDRSSALTEETALQKISGTRTVVDAVVLGAAGKFLEKAARNTGGSVVRAAPGEIGARVRDLILDINSRYLVVYQSRGTKRGWRTIEIRPRGTGVQVINGRKGYFAG